MYPALFLLACSLLSQDRRNDGTQEGGRVYSDESFAVNGKLTGPCVVTVSLMPTTDSTNSTAFFSVDFFSLYVCASIVDIHLLRGSGTRQQRRSASS